MRILPSLAIPLFLAGSPVVGSVGSMEAEAIQVAEELRQAIAKGDGNALARRIPKEGWLVVDAHVSRAELVRSLRPGGELYGSYFDTTRRQRAWNGNREVRSYRDWFTRFPGAKASAWSMGLDPSRVSITYRIEACTTACPEFVLRRDEKGAWWLIQHPEEG